MLVRAGQTEAAVDLARLAGLYPAGVICEIMDEDGTMARGAAARALLPRSTACSMITIKDLIQHRMRHERLVRKIAEANLPTGYGAFRIHAFESLIDKQHHVALVMGEIKPDDQVLVRVHSQCLTGDIFSSSRCDCGDQLHTGAGDDRAGRARACCSTCGRRAAASASCTRSWPTSSRTRARTRWRPTRRSASRPTSATTASAPRSWPSWALHQIRLLTNNPRKFVGLEGYGLEIVDRVPIEIPASDASRRYLKTKKEKLGHLLRSV